MPRPRTRLEIASDAFDRAVKAIDTTNDQDALVAYQKLRTAYVRRKQQIELQAFLGSHGQSHVIGAGYR